MAAKYDWIYELPYQQIECRKRKRLVEKMHWGKSKLHLKFYCNHSSLEDCLTQMIDGKTITFKHFLIDMDIYKK